VSLHPLLRRCWMKRGQRTTIPAPGAPRYTHIFGAYNWRDGRVSYLTQDRKDSDGFIAFIEHVMLTEYPDVKVIMVLDNASYHRSKASMAALSLFEERLHTVWLPKYCPFLNPIERFWLHLKTRAAANRCIAIWMSWFTRLMKPFVIRTNLSILTVSISRTTFG
jgi:transposase